MLFIKFCEAKHNLAKGCPTIGLGTLQFYAEDNPDCLRFDNREGAFSITNNGETVQLNGQSIGRLTSGGVLASNDASIEVGGKFTANFQFPNCYIFCFSQFVSPSINHAKKIDAAYDDWYAIVDLGKFIARTAELLFGQLKVSDLETPGDVTLDWLRGLTLQIVHRECSYDGREFVLNQDSVQQAVHASEDMFRWAFAKEPKHDEVPEHRVLFVLRDAQGQIVPVKKDLKVLQLIPDLGVSTFECNHGA
jgi:hypothetical protein